MSEDVEASPTWEMSSKNLETFVIRRGDRLVKSHHHESVAEIWHVTTTNVNKKIRKPIASEDLIDVPELQGGLDRTHCISERNHCW